MILVMKFGGTSVADAEKILSAAKKAVQAAGKGYQVVVVVSAQGDTTDRMLEKAKTLSPKPSPRELDAYLAAGEQMSAALMAIAIESLGIAAVSLTGSQAGIVTDGVYGDGEVLCLGNHRISQELELGKIVVVAGFQGVGEKGDITTLGRGGSDTTAVALAGLLKAQLCQIYTDVDGIYDKDPRKEADAVKIPYIGYDAMLHLARQGAQVLHDKCICWGKMYNVPIQVLSSFRPGQGSWVTDEPQLWMDCPQF